MHSAKATCKEYASHATHPLRPKRMSKRMSNQSIKSLVAAASASSLVIYVEGLAVFLGLSLLMCRSPYLILCSNRPRGIRSLLSSLYQDGHAGAIISNLIVVAVVASGLIKTSVGDHQLVSLYPLSLLNSLKSWLSDGREGSLS